MHSQNPENITFILGDDGNTILLKIKMKCSSFCRQRKTWIHDLHREECPPFICPLYFSAMGEISYNYDFWWMLDSKQNAYLFKSLLLLFDA